MKEIKITIAAFDFDGTITKKDTLFDFIIFCKGKFRLLVGLIVLSPILIAYKLKIVKNSTAKQLLFSYYFKGDSIEAFNKKGKEYIQRINRISYADSLERMNWHKQQGHTIVIVSASINNWIKPWSDTIKIDKVLSTEIELKNNIITGKFSTNNCYGPEKVSRLLKEYPVRSEYILYAYGDSKGDNELLEIADYAIRYKK